MYDKLSKEMRESILFHKRPGSATPGGRYEGFWPHTTLLRKGFQKAGGRVALPCDIIYERDVPVRLRDGVIVYVDIFRPVTEKKIPAVLCSTTFGKNDSYSIVPDGGNFNNTQLSGYETFEGFDPAWWCDHEYAIVNTDMRGIHASEGDTVYFGCQDAEDNYDIIEYIGTLDWCNGKLGMSGNSWLGITQWYVAALKPPHLAAILPWEGHGDMYRAEYVRGGIPNDNSIRPYLSYGDRLCEDLKGMVAKYPLVNEYWDDKRAEFEKIDIPTYVVASYSNNTLSQGTFEGFRLTGTDKKWLRVHNTMEWPDMYTEYYSQDARKFFDRYLKDIDNDWEKTPRVRVSVLNPDGEDIVDRPETMFPIPDQQLTKLYLNHQNLSLEPALPASEGTLRYVSDDEKDCVRLSYTFPEDTEITGFVKLKLWVEAQDADDMDVFCVMESYNANNEKRVHKNAYLPRFDFAGPDGMLRVSLRETDPEKSTDSEPFYPFNRPQKLEKGQIVPIEIGFWPSGMLYKKGDRLELLITGNRKLTDPKAKEVSGWAIHTYDGFEAPKVVNYNKGTHILHVGGQYDSYLQIPVIKR